MTVRRYIAADGTGREWTSFDDRRLCGLIQAMFPFRKILAEFSDHDANAVRAAWERLYWADPLPVDLAVQVLGSRAEKDSRFPTGLRLDQRPAGAADLIGAANAVLSKLGLREISYMAPRK